jgi:alginate O-acetyltransferase complex protein AlgJ
MLQIARTLSRGVSLAAWVGLGLLTSAAGLAAVNPGLYRVSLDKDVWTGDWASTYSAGFDETLPIRDTSIALWTAASYLLFKEGRDGVLVGEGDWLYSKEEFAVEGALQQTLARRLSDITAVRGELRRRGIELVVALIPAKARVYPEHLGRYRWPADLDPVYQSARRFLADRGIAAPDLLQPLLLAKPATQTFLRTDTHWTPEGAALVAETIAAAIAGDPALGALGDARFNTETAAPIEHRGDLLNFLPLGRFGDSIGPAPDRIVPRSTSAVEAAAIDGAALLGDSSVPAVLVGTSYSANVLWNFDGALRSALHADLVNAAKEGMGPFKPMREMLASTTLADAAPRVVIWEVPERYLWTHLAAEAAK